MRVRLAHDMGLYGERRPTHRAPLPGVLLAPSLAANAGSLSGFLPFATLRLLFRAVPGFLPFATLELLSRAVPGVLPSTSGVPCVCDVAPIRGLTPQQSQRPERAHQCPTLPESGGVVQTKPKSARTRGICCLTLKNPAVANGQISASHSRRHSARVMPCAAREGAASRNQS